MAPVFSVVVPSCRMMPWVCPPSLSPRIQAAPQCGPSLCLGHGFPQLAVNGIKFLGHHLLTAFAGGVWGGEFGHVDSAIYSGIHVWPIRL